MLRRLHLGRMLAALLVALLSISAVTPEGLRRNVQWLSDPARQGRQSGTTGAEASAQYIEREFRNRGFSVQMQEFGGNRRNVVARFGNAASHIVIGAHYDGQGAGHPSASDNAAGVAVMLELASDLKAAELPVALVMVAFDDEEQGLNGSAYYVSHPIYPLKDAVAAVVMDTLGRSFVDLKETTLFVLGGEYSRELAAVAERRKQPDMLVGGVDLIGPRSDFAPFAAEKVPFLFFSHGTHKDYHDSGDTAERIDFPRLAVDGARIGQIVRDIAALRSKPQYSESPAYASGEAATLLRIAGRIRTEKPDLGRAYALMFEDIAARLAVDPSRQTLQVAAAVLLSAATPRQSPFVLDFMVGPYYEKAGKPEIAAAIAEESRRWSR